MSQASSTYPAPHYPPGAARSPLTEEAPYLVSPHRNQSCRSFTGPLSMKCGIEYDQWMLASVFVRPTDTVLELGGRYGTTSCALAAAMRNSGQLMVVEPDGAALPHLLKNRKQQRCSFAIHRGVVGARPLKFESTFVDGSWLDDGYASSTSLAPKKVPRRKHQGVITIQPTPVATLEQSLGSEKHFNVALVDCEGCIESALTPNLVHQLNLVIWEEDGSSSVNNRRWYRRLVSYGFRLHWRIMDSYDRSQAWSREAVHSAWVRVHPPGMARVVSGLHHIPTCEEYKARFGLSDERLLCADARLEEGSSLARDRAVHPVHFQQALRPGEFNHSCEYRSDAQCPDYRGVHCRQPRSKPCSPAWALDEFSRVS